MEVNLVSSCRNGPTLERACTRLLNAIYIRKNWLLRQLKTDTITSMLYESICITCTLGSWTWHKMEYHRSTLLRVHSLCDVRH